MHELLYAQDTVLCSYLRKDLVREVRDGAGTVWLKKFFKGWTILKGSYRADMGR